MSKLVLHIEDNPSNRKVVRHIFRLTDYRLIEAEDGEQGFAKAAGEQPDLILLDMQLPRVSGYDIARQLKEQATTRHIPIVAITAYALSGDDVKALKAGCDDYIAKPYRPHTLLDCIKKYLSDN